MSITPSLEEQYSLKLHCNTNVEGPAVLEYMLLLYMIEIQRRYYPQ